MTRLLINIDVDDIERAVAFYCSALALTVGRRLGPGTVELLGASAPIYLLEKRAGTPSFAGAHAERSYQRHWTPIHLDLVVDDLDAALARALAAGAGQEGSVTEAAWGRMVLMADPFGNGFCILQFSAGGYDELAG
jgi:predicted enzyme related to lactoylglutathione lyase